MDLLAKHGIEYGDSEEDAGEKEDEDDILRSNNKPTPWDKPPLQDRALQQAVDILDTSRFLDSGRKPKR